MSWCRHCDADPVAYRSGLCHACNTYERKYARLPAQHVLVMRQRRRDQRRFEQVARGR